MDLALYHNLESYHAWATGKLFGLCRPLTDDALDASLPIGLGTLRATLQHIAAAEQIWLDRWVGKSTTGLPLRTAGKKPKSLDYVTWLRTL